MFDGLLSPFNQAVQAVPEAIAVKSDDSQVTYRDLDEQANQLAAHLRTLGVEKETFVAICLERSIELVIGLLAIIKAGAAYVPLDPSYPSERLRYMLDDSQAHCLLTTQHIMQQNSLLEQAAVLHRLDIHETLAFCQSHYSTQALNVKFTPQNAVYMIYTSGSTGLPKGVVIEHGAIDNRLTWMQRQFELQADDVVLQKTPYSFDVSVWEFFWPLRVGACLYMAQPNGHKDVRYLEKIIAQENITTLHFVPSMFQLFLAHVAPNKLTSLRLIVCSGEALPQALVTQCLAVCHADLFNLYGPTEAAIDVTFWNCRDVSLCNSVPIGHPIDNIRLYVLDDKQRVVPEGEEGELYIAGVGLARGYWQRPELTRERFVESLLPGEARLYKTGDRVRQLADGSYEYLGRIDHQVKLRGFRIELGEIENQLNQLEDILQSAVMVKGDGFDKQLVAYFVGKKQVATTKHFMSVLSQHMPDYMIPSTFIKIDEMPITSSGKIDRQALLNKKITPSARVTPPRDLLEGQLFILWSKYLGYSQFGVLDDFLSLGGNSILATQIAFAVEKQFNINCPFVALLKQRTIASLAQFVREQKKLGHCPNAEFSVTKSNEALLQQPASAVQQRLWTIDFHEGGQCAAYNLYHCDRLVGALDIQALAASVRALLEEYPVLRSQFSMQAEQLIVTTSAIPIAPLEMSESSEAECLAECARLIATPFNLAGGPLYRFKLWQISSSEFVLLMVLHHSVSDGWSNALLRNRLSYFYAAYISKNPPQLQPLFQYQRFVQKCTVTASSEQMQQQAYAWQQRLQGFEPLALHCDYVRPAHFSYEGQVQKTTLSTELSTQIKEHAKALRITEFSYLFTAFSLLGVLFSNNHQMIIGVPVANRDSQWTQNMVGCCVNTLPVPVEIDDAMSIATLISEIDATLCWAYEHQQVDFKYIVDVVKPFQDPALTPLIQTAFVMQQFPFSEKLTFENVQSNNINLHSKTTKFDLTFEVIALDDTWQCRIEYGTTLFSEQTIAHYLKMYVWLLESMSDDNQLLTCLFENSTVTEYAIQKPRQFPQSAQPLSLIHQFDLSVQQQPNAIALRFDNGSLSYLDLDRWAECVARQLEGGDANYIGICLPSSMEQIVAILAVLKVGRAYVPIDPRSPAARIDYILQDSSVQQVVTTPEILSLHFSNFTAVVKPIFMVPRGEVSNVSLRRYTRNHNDEAYVIYTSGTTGKPKGVPICDHQVIRLFDSVSEKFAFNAKDKWLFSHSFAFDFSVWEMWGALMHGATLVVASDEEIKDAEAFFQLLIAEQVSVLNITPTAFERVLAMLTETNAASLSALRYIIFGGEALNTARLAPWYDIFPQTQPQLVNMYGITEITIHGSFYQLSHKDINAQRYSPIGEPLDDLVFYVCDSALRRVPLGMPGELFVAGPGVAQGYLHKPELTAQRFLVNPFSQEENYQILYKTGDVVRQYFNGSYQYVGRNDNQVKLRGFRIELSAIETTLLSHPEVKNVKVIVQKNNDSAYLAAYIAPIVTINNEYVESLKLYVAKQLPLYMCPKVMHVVEYMPLTANGKIDEQAMQAMVRSHTKPVQTDTLSFAAGILLTIWQQLFPERAVTLNDNFFELGGDSITVIQVVSKARKQGLHIKPKLIYRFPTIVMLQAVVEAEQNEVVQVDKASSFSLSPIQHWLIRQSLPDLSHWNQGHFISLPEQVNISNLAKALRHVVGLHDALSLRFNLQNRAMQYYAKQGEQALFLDLNIDAKVINNVSNRLLLAQQSFDLERGPLFAAVTLIREDKLQLLLVAHHLVVDEVSWRIIVGDLSEAYLALEKNQALSNFKTQSYQHWQYAVADHFQHVSSSISHHWREQLNNITSFPVDKNNVGKPCFQTMSVHTFSCPMTALHNRLQQSDFANIRINEWLMSVWLVAVWRVFDQSRITVMCENHGRDWLESVDVSHTVGWFTNLYPQNFNLYQCAIGDKAAINWPELTKYIAHAMQSAPEQGAGFNGLAYEVDEKTTQACFNYLGVMSTKAKSEPFVILDQQPLGCIGEKNQWPFVLECNVHVSGTYLYFEVMYSQQHYHASTIMQLSAEINALINEEQFEQTEVF